MFPPEIVSLVCGFLQKDDLKQVRQVSKIWEQAAIPYLFNKIFISQDITDFRIAKLIICQFQHYIRTIVFSSINYTKVNRETFRRAFIDNIRMSGIDDNLNTDHSDYAFALYCIMRNKQQESITKDTSSAYLSFALTNLPNIQKIMLTDTSSSRSMSRQSMQVHQPRELKACPVEDCDLTPMDHLPGVFRETVFPRTGSTNPWRVVLSALSTTKANVRELTMEPGTMYLGTNSAAFSMPPWGLSQAILSFRNLTKLRLSLFVDIDEFTTGPNPCHAYRSVAKLLNNAINLENLSFDLCGEPWSSSSLFHGVLGQCRFPKLKSLILAFLTSSDEDLLRLLNHSKRLEHITLSGHTLATGSWMRIADWIRASLPLLKHAELDQLYGGFDEFSDIEEYVDLYGDVGKFLFASGENPFAKKALEKLEAGIRAGRQYDYDGWQGHINANIKYH